MPIPFVGRRYTRAEFEALLSGLKFTSFKPQFVVLHHTASPNLAIRPNGFSPQHLQNLRNYYEDTNGWSGAPHVFIDDQGDGIIVFQRMDRKGIHAASFNSKSWGVEMLGYYDKGKDDPTTGRGKIVYDNTMAALAIMCKALKVEASTIKFHRDDPKTTKTCPGTAISKQSVTKAVSDLMNSSLPQDTATIREIFFESNHTVYKKFAMKSGRVAVHARSFLQALDPVRSIQFKNTELKWGDAMLPVAFIDDAGSAWVFLRDAAVVAGWAISIENQVVTLTKP